MSLEILTGSVCAVWRQGDRDEGRRRTSVLDVGVVNGYGE